MRTYSDELKANLLVWLATPGVARARVGLRPAGKHGRTLAQRGEICDGGGDSRTERGAAR
jgi:hypothetical protein